jgi:membrane fusion protein, multidrug efflux system
VVRVDVGAKVKKGDVLATVDASEFAAGALQASESVKKAERDLERVQALHERGTVPLSDVQNAETGVALAKAGRAAAQVNVGRSALVAPADGVIDMRAIEPGEVVAGGKPVFRMSGTRAGIVARVGVSDRDVASLRLGAPCVITLDSDVAPVAGEVSEIATSASAGTGLFDVEVTLKGALASTRTGGTAKVQIARTVNDLVSVPVSALIDGDGVRAAVYVVKEGKALRKPVTLAFLSSDRAALKAGELEGESMVISGGAGRLRDGSPVSVK